VLTRSTNLSISNDWDDDLTLGVTITSNMARELFNVRDKLRLLGFGSCTADAFPESNGLAGDLALEWAQD
jgi:hypothetical protein